MLNMLKGAIFVDTCKFMEINRSVLLGPKSVNDKILLFVGIYSSIMV